MLAMARTAPSYHPRSSIARSEPGSCGLSLLHQPRHPLEMQRGWAPTLGNRIGISGWQFRVGCLPTEPKALSRYVYPKPMSPTVMTCARPFQTYGTHVPHTSKLEFRQIHTKLI